MMANPTVTASKGVLFGLSGHKKAIFFRQLATTAGSGMPLGRALVSSSVPGMGKLSAELSQKVDRGASLSEAMATYPGHFSPHEVALVKAGEKSGRFDHLLEELAKNAETNWQLTQKIKASMLYPIIVAHSAVFLPPLFLLITQGPQAYFRAVFSIIIPIYLVVGISVYLYKMLNQYPGPKGVIDPFISNLPIFGNPIKMGARIRFLYVLSSLIEAGFLPSQAMPLAADACNNFWLKNRIMRIWGTSRGEMRISEAMKLSGAFGIFEIGLVSSGEDAGSFSDGLRRASETLKPEYDSQVNKIAVLLPIVMLFAVGGIVGFIAVKTMTGIFAPISDLF